jgi:2'-5' RNA ligase
MVRMTDSAGADPSLSPDLPQYALVAYIPGDLGRFLNELRPRLVPDCHLQAHVTLLPPRLLSAPPHQLAAALQACLSTVEPFEVHLNGVEMFPVTDVIYLGLKSGWERLIALHSDLGRGDLAYDEPFKYHPHITLAQEIPAGQLEVTFQRALQAWETWKGPRSFPVERLTFVRNGGPNCWQTVSEHDLTRVSLPKRG